MTNNNDMPEEWRPVVGYEEKYQVSSHGKVKITKSGKILKPYILKSGYHRVSLYLNNNRTHRTVAGIVCEAFIGERPSGLHIDHKDGDKDNNKLSNLEYVTARENQLRLHKRTKGGSVGVCLSKPRNKYMAAITINRKKVTLGYYDTENEATAAYMAAYKLTEMFDMERKEDDIIKLIEEE